MRSPIITLTTDFGLADHYVGVMKGVIASIHPEARTVDICHQIGPYAMEGAAFQIAQAYRFFPLGTVHVVVVDPGVGGPRRPVAARAGDHFFVAPDNGVLSQVFERQAPVVREVTLERHALQPLSHTFHGRDVFAPVAAFLAKGADFLEIGPEITDFVLLPPTAPSETAPGRWRGRLLHIDRFGNLVTSLPATLLGGAAHSFRLSVGTIQTTRAASSYRQFGDSEPFVIAGSSGYLEVSVQQQSAAARSGASVGDAVDLLLDTAGR